MGVNRSLPNGELSACAASTHVSFCPQQGLHTCVDYESALRQAMQQSK